MRENSLLFLHHMAPLNLETIETQRNVMDLNDLMALYGNGTANQRHLVFNASLESFMGSLNDDAQAALGSGGLGFLNGESDEALGENKAHEPRVFGMVPRYAKVKGQSTPYAWPHPNAKILQKDGQDLMFNVELNGKSYPTKIYVVMEGKTPVLLIDQPDIFDERYTGDAEQRLRQYFFFGKAMVELCKATGINPDLLRLNEAQLAPAIMEVRKHQAKMREDIQKLLLDTKIISTNHTQERAALPHYANRDWVEKILGKDAIPEDAWTLLPSTHPIVISENPGYLGKSIEKDGNTYYQFLDLARYMFDQSDAVNFVSKEHGRVMTTHIARSVYADEQLPDAVKKKLFTITNGSARGRWTSAALRNRRQAHVDAVQTIDEVTGKEIIEARGETKKVLNTYLKENNFKNFSDTNRPLIALTRRHVEYKEIGTLLPLIEWMCGDPAKEFTINGKTAKGLGANVLIGGVAQDDVGMGWKSEFEALQDKPELNGRFVFAPRTGIEFMGLCTGSADFWIHGPRPTREACGTSYERAMFNGGWNISTATGGPMEHIRDGENGSMFTFQSEGKSEEQIAAIFDGMEGEQAKSKLVTEFQSQWQNYLLQKLPALVEKQKDPEQAAQMAKDVYESSKEVDIEKMAEEYNKLFMAIINGTVDDAVQNGTLHLAKTYAEYQQEFDQCTAS